MDYSSFYRESIESPDAFWTREAQAGCVADRFGSGAPCQRFKQQTFDDDCRW